MPSVQHHSETMKRCWRQRDILTNDSLLNKLLASPVLLRSETYDLMTHFPFKSAEWLILSGGREVVNVPGSSRLAGAQPEHSIGDMQWDQSVTVQNSLDNRSYSIQGQYTFLVTPSITKPHLIVSSASSPKSCSDC